MPKPAPLAIAGTEGMVVSYARCCFPIPNDPIMAYLSSGRGVVIHREACGNLRNYRKQPDKWLSVTWQPNLDRLFNVEIRIDVATEWACWRRSPRTSPTTETNIEHVAVDERDGDASTLIFDLQVRDRKHLARRHQEPPQDARGAARHARAGLMHATPSG